MLAQILFRENQLRMFTNDEEVIGEAHGFYTYVIFIMFFDFNQIQI
jgi:Na+-driven multidrug efflux pump